METEMEDGERRRGPEREISAMLVYKSARGGAEMEDGDGDGGWRREQIWSIHKSIKRFTPRHGILGVSSLTKEDHDHPNKA